MEALKKTPYPNCHQIDVRGLQPPQESQQHLHIPQDLPSRWAPGLLLLGVDIGGAFFFKIHEKDRKGEIEIEIEREWIERVKERGRDRYI